MAKLSPWPHLVRRFIATVADRSDRFDRELVFRYLNPAERALFFTMSSMDQRHCVALSERLGRDGHDEPNLVRAALLHDVGKATSRVPIVCRVIFSASMVVLPRFAAWLCQVNSGWRRPFYVAAHHARLGADAAARVGSAEQVVRLIDGHGSPGADPLSQTLYDYDRGM